MPIDNTSFHAVNAPSAAPFPSFYNSATDGDIPSDVFNALCRLYNDYETAVYRANDLIRSYNSLSDQFCRTMELLRNEAYERNWCDLYEEFLSTLPGAAQVRTPTRDFAWNGEITYTVTFPVTVMARNEEDAQTKLADYYFSAYPDCDVHGTLPSTDTVVAEDGITTVLVSRKITGEAT